MTEVEKLREAAARLRDFATQATPGPWGDPTEPSIGEFGWCVADCPAGETEDSPQGRADAQYIAAMHPGVGVAVAEWLNREAEAWDDPGIGGGSYASAMAVARAVLAVADRPGVS